VSAHQRAKIGNATSRCTETARLASIYQTARVQCVDAVRQLVGPYKDTRRVISEKSARLAEEQQRAPQALWPLRGPPLFCAIAHR